MSDTSASDTSASDRLQHAGTRLLGLVTRVLVTVVILTIFAGMWYLVYTQRMSPEPLILMIGLVLGYLARLGQELV